MSKLWLFVACVSITICAIATLFILQRGPNYTSVEQIETQSGLSIILPDSLPPKSRIETQPTYDRDKATVTTSIRVGDNLITFSQQKRPEIELRQIDDEENYLVDIGSVYILKSEEGRRQAIVETSGSWILVNAPDAMSVQSFKSVIASLSEI